MTIQEMYDKLGEYIKDGKGNIDIMVYVNRYDFEKIQDLRVHRIGAVVIDIEHRN